jgi:hypothetical protein
MQYELICHKGQSTYMLVMPVHPYGENNINSFQNNNLSLLLSQFVMVW